MLSVQPVEDDALEGVLVAILWKNTVLCIVSKRNDFPPLNDERRVSLN